MASKDRTEKLRPNTIGFWQKFWHRQTAWAVLHKFWQRLGIGLLVLVILLVGSAYGVARWYIAQNEDKPLEVGTTFVADYARDFGLDPRETLEASLSDIGFKRLRLVSYWDNHEPTEGQYDFSELDWQFDLAKKYDVDVSLAIGLRQPRWPECHMPDWAAKKPHNEWREPLYRYIETTVNRYKDHPNLVSYQLENEFFLEVFGICTDFDRDRLIHEYELVKNIDDNTPVAISRSNNATPSWPIGDPRADIVGAAIYKRVWDRNMTLRYFEYPVPAWYYGFLAGMTKLTTNRESFIHELQAEPWVDERLGGIRDVSIEEQYKTMNPSRLVSRIEYGRATGMRIMDLWGMEWWYWLKTKQNAPEMWSTAKSELQKIHEEN